MSQFLIKFSANWADEMDLNGWDLYTRLEWDNVETAILGHKYPVTVSVGSNEEIEFENAKQLLDSYTVEQISDEDAAVLIRLFDGYGERGIFKRPWEYWDSEEDEPEPSVVEPKNTDEDWME